MRRANGLSAKELSSVGAQEGAFWPMLGTYADKVKPMLAGVTYATLAPTAGTIAKQFDAKRPADAGSGQCRNFPTCVRNHPTPGSDLLVGG